MDQRPVQRGRWLDIGWLIGGAIIIFVGGYYLLRNTLGFALPELDWDIVWPLAVIALGAGIVWRTWFTYSHPTTRP